MKEHNHLYYNKDNPKISDQEYDELKREILSLEDKNSYLKSLNLLSKIVGASPTNKSKNKTFKPNAFIIECIWQKRYGRFYKKSK